MDDLQARKQSHLFLVVGFFRHSPQYRPLNLEYPPSKPRTPVPQGSQVGLGMVGQTTEGSKLVHIIPPVIRQNATVLLLQSVGKFIDPA